VSAVIKLFNLGASGKGKKVDVLEAVDMSSSKVNDDANKKRNASNISLISDINEKGKKKKKKPSPVESEIDQEAINALRNRLNIRVKGQDIENPSPSFSNMKICQQIKNVLLLNIEKSNWKEPTPIQMQAIPVGLEGRDILAAAPTGSGKTAAFVIPILSKLSSETALEKGKKRIRALILVPTKELAEQIHRETTRLCEGKRMKLSVLNKQLISTAMHKQVCFIFIG
jgi:ATP-dependent RNA helicase DDX52/ROK1